MFNVKYLGMTLVGQPKGEEMASPAIRRIVATVSHWSLSASYNLITKLTLALSCTSGTLYFNFIVFTEYGTHDGSISTQDRYILMFSNSVAH